MSTENDPFRTWRAFGRELRLLREAIRAHLLVRVVIHRLELERRLSRDARARYDAAEARAHAEARTHHAACGCPTTGHLETCPAGGAPECSPAREHVRVTHVRAWGSVCECAPDCPACADPAKAGLEPDETNGARAAKAV